MTSESENDQLKSSTPGTCPICGSVVKRLYSKHHGYQAPDCYDIFGCLVCEVEFAWPLKIDPKVYSLIYQKVESVPGYQRYLEYAETIKSHPAPLDYLAESEAIYWSVRKYLLRLNQKKPLKILEVGCGMGYLTYAIHSQGFDILGLDISFEAIEKAKKQYGEFYLNSDLIEFSKTSTQKFDLVIMTEVIEHIPNIFELFQAIDRVLSPNGSILITTPNKSVCADTVLWDTDPPPVHLWWFSETSMRFLAYRLGCSLDFIDFSKTDEKAKWMSQYHPTKPQVFDRNGNILDQGEKVHIKMIRILMKKMIWLRPFIYKLYLFIHLFKKMKCEFKTKELMLSVVFTKNKLSSK